jgi:hypothetical protein
MNKRFLIAWVVTFVLWMAGSFVVHGALLYDDYAKLPKLFRPESEAPKYFHWMIVAHVLLAGAFTWIYARGAEAKPWLAQGLRYGIAVALLTAVPTYTIYYVVQPIPGSLAIRQMVFDGILLLILGAVVAFLHREPQGA